MADPGYFITFEGPEGSGKSTQIERLAQALRAEGHSVVTTREPGGTPIGEAIRAILLDREATGMTPWTEALLFTAARAQLVRDVIRPRLAVGDVVICDRYADSTMAYQGYGRRLDRDALGRLQDVATGGLKPDLTLLLSLSVEMGLRRISGDHRDRLDDETITFHMAVHDAYLKLAAQEPSRWREVDASLTPDGVAFNILQIVKEALANVGVRRSA
jgi:dTMP kinase